MEQLQVRNATATNVVGIKETSEFIAFIGSIAGIVAKNAKAKGSFLTIAKDLVMTVFDAQLAIEGFNLIGSELADLTADERAQLEATIRTAIIRQMGDTTKIDAVAAPLTVAAISIYQSIAILRTPAPLT